LDEELKMSASQFNRRRFLKAYAAYGRKYDRKFALGRQPPTLMFRYILAVLAQVLAHRVGLLLHGLVDAQQSGDARRIGYKLDNLLWDVDDEPVIDSEPSFIALLFLPIADKSTWALLR
jgi:hypothetical protein